MHIKQYLISKSNPNCAVHLRVQTLQGCTGEKSGDRFAQTNSVWITSRNSGLHLQRREHAAVEGTYLWQQRDFRLFWLSSTPSKARPAPKCLVEVRDWQLAQHMVLTSLLKAHILRDPQLYRLQQQWFWFLFHPTFKSLLFNHEKVRFSLGFNH